MSRERKELTATPPGKFYRGGEGVGFGNEGGADCCGSGAPRGELRREVPSLERRARQKGEAMTKLIVALFTAIAATAAVVAYVRW